MIFFMPYNIALSLMSCRKSFLCTPGKVNVVFVLVVSHVSLFSIDLILILGPFLGLMEMFHFFTFSFHFFVLFFHFSVRLHFFRFTSLYDFLIFCKNYLLLLCLFSFYDCNYLLVLYKVCL